MKTNADCTIFNKYVDPATRTERYQRTQIHKVVWENRKAANVIASGGNIAADQAAVYIPMARGADYLQPVEWLALTNKTGKWTLKAGDVIVKGLIDEDISPSALKAKYNDVLEIASVDTMDQGSPRMWHWQIGGR